MIDDKDFDWFLAPVEAKPELVAERCREGRSVRETAALLWGQRLCGVRNIIELDVEHRPV